MECDLCHEPAATLRGAVIREDIPRPWDDAPGPGYREALVCPACYARMDNPLGQAEIAGRGYSMAGVSRTGGEAVDIREAESWL